MTQVPTEATHPRCRPRRERPLLRGLRLVTSNRSIISMASSGRATAMGLPTLGLGQHFGVIDRNCAAVSQVNDERLKRSGGMQCTQLFNRHGDILAGQSQAINWVHTRICGRRFF